MALERIFLFGGNLNWNPADWTASDDRVRGGKSQSYLECSPSDPEARFYGILDVKTLGGAGFASQRTASDDRSWNVDGYDGILLDITKSDSKKYTFNIKNELLPPDPDTGREQSTISYEYDFTAPSPNTTGECTAVFIPWEDMKATYRGREDKDAPAVNLKDIRRFSIMMRSFFGDQEGPFSLSIKSISAVRKPSHEGHTTASETPQKLYSRDLEKALASEYEQKGHARAEEDDSSPAERRSPPIGRAVYCVAAVMLALWVLSPGNLHST